MADVKLISNPRHQSAPETFKLSDKGVADMVEAILGAAYRAGGSQLCDKALTKFGMGSLVALELTRDVASVDEISGTTFQEFESNIEQVEAMLKYDLPSSLFSVFNVNLHVVGRRYKFLAPQLCLQALIHPSFESLPSSSRLQFVGDAALDILVTERHILHNFPSLSPGEITDLRSAIVNHANLTMVAFRMGLDQVIIHKSNTLQRSIQLYEFVLLLLLNMILCSRANFNRYKAKVDTNRFCKDYEYVDIWSTDDPRPVGDALEALIGAVLIDSNGDLGRVWEVFGPILQPSLDFYATPHKSTAVPLREMYEIAQKKACKQVKVRFG
jgi:endoribonuclease Dicer